MRGSQHQIQRKIEFLRNEGESPGEIQSGMYEPPVEAIQPSESPAERNGGGEGAGY